MSKTIRITHGRHKGTATVIAKYQARVTMDDGTEHTTGLHNMGTGMHAEIRRWLGDAYPDEIGASIITGAANPIP